MMDRQQMREYEAEQRRREMAAEGREERTMSENTVRGYAWIANDGTEMILCPDHLTGDPTSEAVWAIRDDDVAAEPPGTFVCCQCGRVLAVE